MSEPVVKLEGGSGAVMRPDGKIEVYWPSGHVSGPFTLDEWEEMVRESRTPG